MIFSFGTNFLYSYPIPTVILFLTDFYRLTERRFFQMINIAFCFETDSDLDYMKKEVTQCFERRGICVSAHCCHNVRELIRIIGSSFPDILFYDPDSEQGLMRKAAIAIKKHNPNMVSIVTTKKDYIASPDDILLEPFYPIPNKSRRQLWSYAAKAYESAINDKDTFEYYKRPCYAKLPIGDIRYFVSEARRTHIIYEDGIDTFYKKLDEVEEIVKNKRCQFLRIHKSYLVNVKYIAGFDRRYVKLTNGERIKISNGDYYRNLIVQLHSETIRF